MKAPKRLNVRVECPQCAGGSIGHMTADELLERAIHEGCNLSCPLCGRIYLSREEIERIEEEKIVYSDRYLQIRLLAESTPCTEHRGEPR